LIICERTAFKKRRNLKEQYLENQPFSGDYVVPSKNVPFHFYPKQAYRRIGDVGFNFKTFYCYPYKTSNLT
jgi:hypothetical protein